MILRSCDKAPRVSPTQSEGNGAPRIEKRLSQGEKHFYRLVLALVAALLGGFWVAGLAGTAMVMLALVPVIFVTLILIATGD
ncbi:MAG: hypothetical protein ACRBCL_02760 [Maritimibacter sp.]